MENASKALIMAGGILIAIVIISLLVILFNGLSGIYAEESSSLEVEQLAQYNQKFAAYDNTSGLYGSELLSLANLAQEYNTKLASSLNYSSTTEAENAKDEYYNKYKIELDVKIDSIVGGTISDNDGNAITSVQSAMLRQYLKGKISGTYSLEQLIAFNTELISLSKTSSDAKSLLGELKESVFNCDTDQTETVDGKITHMYFEKE